MPRPGVIKTYGRASRAPTHANKTFDEIMAEKKPSTSQMASTMAASTMAASTIHRWGKTSFTSKRSTPQAEETARKRKASDDSDDEEMGFGDPFSFDSDDDGPSKPKRGMGYKKPADKADTTTTKIPAGDKMTKSQFGDKKENSDRSAFDCLFDLQVKQSETNNGKTGKSAASKTASIKTYSRPGKEATVTKNSTAKGLGENKKQLSMDSFTTKISSKPLLSFTSRLGKGTSSKAGNGASVSKRVAKTRKFFTSRGDGGEDHNYSQSLSGDAKDDHTYSSSQESSKGKNVLSSDDERDSDWDIPSNGHQSPKKTSPAKKKQHVESAEQLFDRAFADGKMTSLAKKKQDVESADQLFDKAIADGKITFNQVSNSAASDNDSKISDNEINEDSNSVCSNNSGQSSSASGPSRLTYSRVRKNHLSQSSPTKGKLSIKSESWSGKRIVLEVEKKKRRDEPVVRRLLTSPKKGDVRNKGKALYNPRKMWQSESHEEVPAEGPDKPTPSSSQFDEDFDDEPAKPGSLPILRRAQTWPKKGDELVAKVQITREHKPLFTVVRNVKQAHECQEHGETQEFKDDIEYIIDGLHDSKISIRCLSSISLATKCTMPAFRMHLRAHGTLTKIFSALHDAAKYPTLALCTAGVMYMMSRDRIGMDLEKSTLELMLSLLSMDSQQETLENDNNEMREYDRIKDKLQLLCDKLDKEGNVKHFVLEEVSTGHMAMETLLSLTSRRAGDWFKEELRTLGGLNHIINTVSECVNDLDDMIMDVTDTQLDRLRKVDRCLRVLENVTYLNSDNQQHLIIYKSSALITAVHRVMKLCEDALAFNEMELTPDKKVDKDSPGFTIFNTLLAVLRILLNLTHDHEVGSARVGQQGGLISSLLNCILRVPKYVITDQRFDLLVLGLGLMINMVEHCHGNRSSVLKTKTSKPFEMYNPINAKMDALDALALLFNLRYKAARQIEEEHDRELEERERKKAEEKGAARETGALADQSGEWKESESGLEWVMVPLEERKQNVDDASSTGSGNGAVVATKTLGLSLDSDDDVDIVPTSQDENDEKFTEALHKAGRHMEDSIVAAYVSLLLGCLIEDSTDLARRIRDNMPDDSFEPMIRMLKKFLGFMNFTSATGGSKSILRVIEILQKHQTSLECDEM